MIKHFIIAVGLVLLIVGCTNPEVIYINRTINGSCIPIIINNTITINNTIIEPGNVSCPEVSSTIYDRQYVLGMIRQLKYYEDMQDLSFNDTECQWELNQSNVKLNIAEEELCNWNSSWC